MHGITLHAPRFSTLLVLTILTFIPVPVAAASTLPSARAASTLGGWVSAGHMHMGRSNHTATLMRDGWVLIAGGVDYSGYPLSSVELYNPHTGKWKHTHPMHDRRAHHTATLLPNGQVLVVGGCCDNTGVNDLATAELYNPATGLWTATGSLYRGRGDHTATLLPNGQVLVAGGAGCDGSCPYAYSELYDPITGQWTGTGSMATARTFHTATLLPNGKVLVTGGTNLCCTYALPNAELYDPALGIWSVTGNMSIGRELHTASLLYDGNVLVMGGCHKDYCDDPLASAELYHPATGAWTATGSMHNARTYNTTTRLLNGQILVTGGFGGDEASTEIYNPRLGTWTSMANMLLPRLFHTATLLPTGQVLVVGGYNSCDETGCNVMARAELYTQ